MLRGYVQVVFRLPQQIRFRVQIARSGSGLGDRVQVGFGDQVRVQFGVGFNLGSGSAQVQVFEQVRVSNTVTRWQYN